MSQALPFAPSSHENSTCRGETGFPQRHVDKPLNDFTILAQGQVVDSSSETRLSSGVVGFFCVWGEKVACSLCGSSGTSTHDALGFEGKKRKLELIQNAST